MRQGAFHLAVHTICQIAEVPKWHKEFPAKCLPFIPIHLHYHHATWCSINGYKLKVCSPAFGKRWTPCSTAKSPWRAACWVGRWEPTNLGHIKSMLACTKGESLHPVFPQGSVLIEAKFKCWCGNTKRHMVCLLHAKERAALEEISWAHVTVAK